MVIIIVLIILFCFFSVVSSIFIDTVYVVTPMAINHANTELVIFSKQMELVPGSCTNVSDSRDYYPCTAKAKEGYMINIACKWTPLGKGCFLLKEQPVQRFFLDSKNEIKDSTNI